MGAGGGPTVALPGLSRGPNVAGVTANMWGAGGLINNGTLPGVYGDLGIFYATAPETAYGSYTGGTITNNSGDTVGLRTPLGTPLNKWDAWQMAAFGIAGTSNPAYPSSPIIDSNGRGNTGWGLANAVAGPQSGYAWQFNLDAYKTCTSGSTAPNAGCINTATQQMGPWQRIQYPGSQIAYDTPGDISAGMFNGGLDGSTTGFALSPTTPLTATVSQTDTVSPKAIRFALGQLTYLRPEYVWVKIKVQDPTALVDVTGCPVFHIDTFGGDAGGDDGGKDHIWRYYDPNSVVTNGCIALGKPATRDIVKIGDTFQYKVKAYNLGTQTITNLIIRDTLPSGVTFISAVPAQNSGPNPLQWNIGNFLPGQKFEATVTVRASGSGILNNCIQGTGTLPSSAVSVTACEKTPSGSLPYLKQTKSVSPAAVAPGGQVQYTVLVENIGTGATGSPVIVTEDMPTGFTYVSKDSVTINGANVTVGTTVNSADLRAPVFTVPAALNAGQSLVLKFTAKVAATQTPGAYCNAYRTN